MKSQSFFVLACFLILEDSVPAADKPFQAKEAPRHMTVPEGFNVTLFAGEPDVVQPIAFTFDDRGRLWVVECNSYPKWRADGKPGKDRVLIFEDRDGKGTFDTCKVFYDKGTNLSGIQLGFGGVWLCSTPNLVFIPDRDGDDVPDGPPEVVLDGWDVIKAQHNVFNSLAWGPDGWLYGCNGIQSNSRVGKPGTPDKERVPINCGVWRYHPVRKSFEVVATGTTNPWGLDFDDFGQMFITNCVIHHLWHVIPGAHFQRMYGQDFNPHWYSLMNSCADHIHWGGGHWTTARDGKGANDVAGGGHAHVGAMVYLGDNWPERYRNGLFTCNLHGSRVNHDTLERSGSGYVARHAKDFLFANDPWFRGLAIHQGPDGGVFISDWTDTGECHNYAEVDRSNGRIYKVTHGKPTPFKGDLSKLSDQELIEFQFHKNDWHVRHARRLLQERAAAGKLGDEIQPRLRAIMRNHTDTTRRLRALWILHVIGALNTTDFKGLLDDRQEWLRAWGVQLVLESRQPDPAFLGWFASMARSDKSPLVRLFLASGLQRLPAADRWAIAERLVGHAEDAADLNLPLMLWYGIEPLVPVDPRRSAEMISLAKLPLLREYLARRLTLLNDSGLAHPVGALGQVKVAEIHRDILRGVQEALHGRRDVAMPGGWPAVRRKLMQSSLAEVREKAILLSVVFGDAEAIEESRKTITDRAAPLATRQAAIEALVYKKDAQLVPILQAAISDPGIRVAAIRGLAAFQHPDSARILLEQYKSFAEAEKAETVHSLTSRPEYALALLNAIEQKQIPRSDVSAFTIRQLLGFKNEELNARIGQVWGAIRPASAEKAGLMTKYKTLLSTEYVKQADRSRGRQIYVQNCASCHRLFGEGSDIGPELTGAQRFNLDYVLDNVLDPSAIVAKEYQVTLVETKDGRLLTGIIKLETDRAVTMQTQNERVIVPKGDIEARTQSAVSMMPEGIFSKLKDDEVRDLISYLASHIQVPLPKGKAGK